MAFIYYNWEEVDINWEALHMNWEEVGFLEELLTGKGSGIVWAPSISKRQKRWYDLEQLNKLPEEKKRLIVRIVAKIQGEEFEEYKYKNEDIIITAEHINIILDALDKNLIKVNVKNVI